MRAQWRVKRGAGWFLCSKIHGLVKYVEVKLEKIVKSFYFFGGGLGGIFLRWGVFMFCWFYRRGSKEY